MFFLEKSNASLLCSPTNNNNNVYSAKTNELLMTEVTLKSGKLPYKSTVDNGSQAIGGFFRILLPYSKSTYCHQSQGNHVMRDRPMMQFLCENGTFSITCIENMSWKLFCFSWEDLTDCNKQFRQNCLMKMINN